MSEALRIWGEETEQPDGGWSIVHGSYNPNKQRVDEKRIGEIVESVRDLSNAATRLRIVAGDIVIYALQACSPQFFEDEAMSNEISATILEHAKEYATRLQEGWLSDENMPSPDLSAQDTPILKFLDNISANEKVEPDVAIVARATIGGLHAQQMQARLLA